MSNLSPHQFPEHGYVDLNDHHEALGLERHAGNIGLSPHSMRRTGERVDVTPDMRLIPGQPTVYAAAVHEIAGAQGGHSPISLYKDGDDHYVLDGHHRLTAARLAGRSLPGEYYA